MISYITNTTIRVNTVNTPYSTLPLGTLESIKKHTKANANKMALPTNTPINVLPKSKPATAKEILNNNAEK